MSLSWLRQRMSNRFSTGGRKAGRSCLGQHSRSRIRHFVRPMLEPLEERYLLDGNHGLSFTSIAGQIVGAAAGMVGAVTAAAKPPSALTGNALTAFNARQAANFYGNAMNLTSGILVAAGAPGTTAQSLRVAGDGTQFMSALAHGIYLEDTYGNPPSTGNKALDQVIQDEEDEDDKNVTSFGLALLSDVPGMFSGQVPKLIGDALAPLHDGLSLLIDLGPNPINWANVNWANVTGDIASLVGDFTGLINDALGDSTPPPILQINDIGYDPSVAASAFAAPPAADFNYAGPVAYFSIIPSDPNNFSPPLPNTFSALINWGDGTSSVGQVESDIGSPDTADPSGGYVVVGSHTYAASGDYPLSVVITGNGMQGQDQGDVTVAPDFDSYSFVEPDDPEPVAGQTFNGPVVSFTSNAQGNQNEPDFSALINWGDGSTSAGQISDGQVFGSHIYAQPGNYSANVQIAAPDGTRISGSTSVYVAPEQGLNANSVNGNAAGLTYSGPVATFTDSDGDINPGDYSAAITWDDGTTSTGQIVYNNGTFSVLGTHTYAQPGTYDVTDVSISAPNGAPADILDSTVTVGFSLTANNLTVPAGQLFTTPLANFTWADPNAQASDFDVTVDNWGGGTSDIYGAYVGPEVQVVSNGNGHFSIVGTHTYLGAGTYNLQLSVTPPDGGDTLTANSTITAGASTLSVTAQNLSITPTPSANLATPSARSDTAPAGGNVNGAVATFTAPAGASAGEYSAVINWGDGDTSTGQVVANSNGGFNVLGSHTYSQIEGYLTSVQVSDTNGNVASAFGMASPPPPTSSVNPLPAVETSPSFTVSWFGSDPNGPGVASYNVYVSDNGGAFTPWLTGTTQTSAAYTGQAGHSYGFYSVAIDQLGVSQPAPTAAQATTTVQVPGNNNPGNNNPGNTNPGNSNPGSHPIGNPNPAPPDVPPFLAWINQVLGGSETVNANGTTITDSLFGFPLMETYNFSGNLVSVTLLGFNITFLF